jgi:hypothetical protein
LSAIARLQPSSTAKREHPQVCISGSVLQRLQMSPFVYNPGEVLSMTTRVLSTFGLLLVSTYSVTQTPSAGFDGIEKWKGTLNGDSDSLAKEFVFD